MRFARATSCRGRMHENRFILSISIRFGASSGAERATRRPEVMSRELLMFYSFACNDDADDYDERPFLARLLQACSLPANVHWMSYLCAGGLVLYFLTLFSSSSSYSGPLHGIYLQWFSPFVLVDNVVIVGALRRGRFLLILEIFWKCTLEKLSIFELPKFFTLTVI